MTKIKTQSNSERKILMNELSKCDIRELFCLWIESKTGEYGERFLDDMPEHILTTLEEIQELVSEVE